VPLAKPRVPIKFLPELATDECEPQLIGMRTDFSVFRKRLSEACGARNMTEHQLYRRIGLTGRRAVDFELFGVKVIDIYGLARMADELDVSIDWLLGRSDAMEVIERPEFPEPPPKKVKKPSLPRP
jgi:hypothetical protein